MRHRLVLLPVLLATLVGAPPALAWTWPADGPVLQPFVFGGDPYAAGQHRGIDVAGPPGAAVRAPAAGTVSFAGTVPGGGRTVTIQTADGLAVTLLHLGALGVSRGATVAEGASVGTLSPAGDSDHAVPYVQLGVRVAADPQGYLDPLLFLPARTPVETEAAPVGEPAPDSAEVPADPVPAPEVGAAAPEAEADTLPQEVSNSGGATVPAESGAVVPEAAPAEVEAPATFTEMEVGAGAAPAALRASGTPARGVAVGTDPAESPAAATPAVSAPARTRVPPEPSGPQPDVVAAATASRDARESASGLAAAVGVLVLVTSLAAFGWIRRARIPAVRPRSPGYEAGVEPKPVAPHRRTLDVRGGSDRRPARCGPHADSRSAAPARSPRTRRQEVLDAA